jgi:2-phosphosulfolactate phosphatase
VIDHRSGGGGFVRVDVALVPDAARRWRDVVCIVVDELRASSTIVTLLERGAGAVVPAANVAEARRLAAGNGHVLAGERNVVRPPGFDFGNSPTEIDGADLRGHDVVLSTRNGTAVLRGLRGDPAVVIGCLLNASACARSALALARASGASIGIVCAGRLGGFAIDDALAAGYLVDRLLALAGDSVELSESAAAARRLWQTTPDIAAAFRSSISGQLLSQHELEADIAFCLATDTSEVVPVLVRGVPMRLEPLMA